MLISHTHKFITIDIPKTGSRSLRESLFKLKVIDIYGSSNPDLEFYQHGPAIKAEEQFKKNNWDWNKYFKFTIVRNPWVRYFSFFKYFKNYKEKYLRLDKSIKWNKAETNQGKLCVELFKDKDDQSVLKNIILNNDSQDSYYCNENGKIIVDHIASFENLPNEFIFLCNQVGIIAPTLKHANKSSDPQNMNQIYNKELIDLVAKKEKAVIKLKRYTI